MTTRTIAIGIDPSKSTAGKRVVKRDLEEIGEAAAKTEQQVNKTGDGLKKMGGGATAANDNLKKMTQSANSANSALIAIRNTIMLAVAAFTALAGAALVTAFMQYADTAKNLNSQLKLVTSSSEELADVQEKLFRIAQGSRSDYEATVQLYAKLARSSKDLGLSQGAMLKITDTINKSFVVSGATSEEAGNAIRQLAQGLSAGALRGDEFNAVAEQAPRLLEALRDHLKMNSGQLREFAAQGGITADVLTRALFGAAEKINSEFDQMGVTIGAASTVLRNSLIKTVGELDAKLGVSNAIAQGIIAIANGIESLTSNLDKLYKIVQITTIAFTALFAEAILTGIASMVTLVGTGLVNAFIALNAVIRANPLVFFATLVATAVTAVYYFRDEIEKAIGIDVWGIVKGTVNLIISAFVGAYDDIKMLWDTFPDIIEAAMIGALNMVGEGLDKIFIKTIDGVNWLRRKVGVQEIPTEGLGVFTPVDNPAADRVKQALAEREKRLSETARTDWLSKLGHWWQGDRSEPGVMPSANDNAELPPAKEAGQTEKQLKAYNDLIEKGNLFIKMQEAERAGIGLTEEAARALRLEQQMLNKAQQDNINLTPEQTSSIKQLALAMAAAEAQTKKMQEAYDFTKDTFKGFFSDMAGGLREGKGLWKSFADAVVNALNKIIDKMLDKAFDQLFDSLFTAPAAGAPSGAGGLAAANSNTPATQALTAPVIPVIRKALGDITQMTGSMGDWAAAIRKTESGSFAGNYGALGPITRSGDRAYGAYQVMGNNIPSWSKQAFGQSMSKEQFLADPAAQDAIFKQQFGNSVAKYGTPQDAASVWFTGRPMGGSADNAKDILGTTGNGYVDKFNNGLKELGATTKSANDNIDGMGSSAGAAASGMKDLGGGMSAFGKALASAQSSGNGGLLSALQGLSGIGQSIFNSSFQFRTAFTSGIPGLWSEGGYTGPGGKQEPRGIVHAGEIIWSQEDIARAGGVEAVEAMRSGRGRDVPGVQAPSGRMRSNVIAASPMSNMRIANEVLVRFDESGNPHARVREVAREEATARVQDGIAEYDYGMPDRMQYIERNPRRRGSK